MRPILTIHYRYSQELGRYRTRAFYAISSVYTLTDEDITSAIRSVDKGQDVHIAHRHEITGSEANYYEVEVTTDSGD